MSLASRAVAILNEKYRRLMNRMQQLDWARRARPFVMLAKKCTLATKRKVVDVGRAIVPRAKRKAQSASDPWLMAQLEPRLLMTTLYWDTSASSGLQGGSGAWSTTDANWNTAANGTGSRVAWIAGADAVFSVNGAATITLSGSVNAKSITFSGTGYTLTGSTLTLTGANITVNQNATINNAIGGSVGLTKLGGATLSLGATNTFSGTTSVKNGTLSLQHGDAVNHAITIDGGKLVTTAANAISGSGTTLTINSGTATLGNSNNYTGGTTLKANANLNINAAGALGSGTFTILGGNIDNTSGAPITLGTNAIAWNGTLTFKGSSNLNLGTGAVSRNANRVIIVKANTLTMGGVLSGSTTITKEGAGTLNLSAHNTFTGMTTVAGGTLVVSGTFGNAGVTVSNGILSLQNAGAISKNTITISGGTSSVVQTVANAISGTAAIVIQNGAAILSSSNSYSGSTTINANGTLHFNASGAIGSGTLVINGGTLKNTSGSAVTNASNNPIKLSGNFKFDGTSDLNLGTGAVTRNGARTITVNSSALTIGGVLSGTYTTTKAGSGTLVLNGSNANAGAVTVNAGTLGGTGSLGNVTVNNAAVISPGSPVSGTGILGTKNLQLNAGSIFNVQLNGNSAGTGYDRVSVTGTVTLNASSVLNLSGTRTAHAGDSLVIIENDGADAVTGTFSGLAEGALVTVNGVNYYISYHGGSGNDVVLNDTPSVIGVADVYTTSPNLVLNGNDATGGTTSGNANDNGVLANDSGAVSVTHVSVTTNGTTVNRTLGGTNVTVTTPAGGQFKIYPNGTFVYTPAADFAGFDGDGTSANAITYTLSDGASLTATAGIRFVVPFAAGQDINAQADTPFSGRVATIADSNFSGVAGDYTATINWGDGTSSSGSISKNSTTKLWEVSGTHTYAEDGDYQVKASMTHTATSTTVTTRPVGTAASSVPRLITLLPGAAVKLNTLLGSSGNNLQIGDKIFTNFTASRTGNMPLTSEIDVLGIGSSATGEYGLEFHGDFKDLPGGGASDLLITYDIKLADANAPIAIASTMIDSIVTGTGFAQVSDTFLPDITTGYATVYQMAASSQKRDSFTFPTPMSVIHAQKDILITTGSSGTAAISRVEQRYIPVGGIADVTENTAPYFTSDPYAHPQGSAFVVENDGAGVPAQAQKYLQIVRSSTHPTLRYALTGADAEQNPVSFSLVNGPAGMTIENFNGVPTLTWTAQYDGITNVATGAYVARVRVTDSHGLFSADNDQVITINVVDPGANHAPQFVSSPVIQVHVGETYVYLPNVFDPDGDTLTFTNPTGNPSGLTISNVTGRVSWTPTAQDVGDHSVIVTVDDSHEFAWQTYTIHVLGDPVVSDYLPDLTVSNVDATKLNVNKQSLTVQGVITAKVSNIGVGTDAMVGTVSVHTPSIAATPFTVLFFEDLDFSRTFTPENDHVLGSTQVSQVLGEGDDLVVAATIQGSVRFAGAHIWAFVDSGDVVDETDETNNVNRSGRNEKLTNVPGAIQPELLWSFEGDGREAMMAPAVADINEDGTPDVIAITFNTTFSAALRVLDGETGAEIWHNSDYEMQVNYVTVGDINGDGHLEILADVGSFMDSHIAAFDYTGDFLWISDHAGVGAGSVSLADLDGDGIPEIIAGRDVLDGATGDVIATGDTSGRGQGSNSRGINSIVVDLNMDGTPEILAGSTAYEPDGTIFDQADSGDILDGWTAVGNFNDDPYPEIVVVFDKVVLLDHNMNKIWDSSELYEGGGVDGFNATGGAPLIADLDGDGRPEIGVAGKQRYMVFSADGSILWQAPILDISSHYTGSTAFDLNGDGEVEVIHADEHKMRIFRGYDGMLLYSYDLGSGTASESPIVADVDGDGQANIIVTANDILDDGGKKGIFVFKDHLDNWAPTRKIWNQFNYHITNVNDDGTIPEDELNSWSESNTYRVNEQSESFIAGDAADLIPSYIRVTLHASDTDYQVRIGNGGNHLVPPGVSIAFYDRDPSESGAVLLGTELTTASILPDHYEDVTFTYSGAALEDIWVVVDDDGTGVGAVDEFSELNNAMSLGLGSVPFPFHAPIITSTPDDSIVENSEYIYNVSATDVDVPDTEQLMYQLVKHPAGMVIDAVSGEIRWTPRARDIGDNTVIVRVLDGNGGIDVQPFIITVTPENVAPVIDSNPDVATPSSSWSYQVTADDADGDTLTYTLISGPSGAAFTSPTSGLLEWTTDALTTPRAFVIQVSDGHDHFDHQAFWLPLPVVADNHRPEITSVPSPAAVLGREYFYDADATDPDGDPVLWVLDSGPAGAVLNSSTGEFTWTPAIGDIADPRYPVPVRIQVIDTAGDSDVQAFNINVEGANSPPIITTIGPNTAVVGVPYKYHIHATDRNNDDITYTAVVDGFGDVDTAITYSDSNNATISWTPSETGNFSMVVTANDGNGGTYVQRYNIVVTEVPADTPPIFDVDPVTKVTAGSAYTFTAHAFDPDVAVSGAVTYALQAFNSSGASISLPTGLSINTSTGAITWSGANTAPHAAKTFNLKVVATQDGINSELPFTLLVTNASDTTAPKVIMNLISAEYATANQYTGAPAIGGSAKITGLATDAAGIVSYKWEYAQASSAQFTVFAQGTFSSPSTSADVEGTFDTTLLANDTYTIRLSATDAGGNTTSVTRNVDVIGDAKVGNFRFTETDMTIPVAGIPLTLSRSYDTLNRNSSSDFGFGWSFGMNLDFHEVSETRGQVTVDLFDNDLNRTNDRALDVRTGGNRDIWLTLPDGRRTKFTYIERRPIGESNSTVFEAVYIAADPSVHATLEFDAGESNEMHNGPLGAYFDVDQPGTAIGYDVRPYHEFGHFVLTMEDGTKFYIEKTERPETATVGARYFDIDNDPSNFIVGLINHTYYNDPHLTKIVDPFGNEIRLTPNGMTQVIKNSSGTPIANGASITYHRDAQGRIDSVADAAGVTVLKYTYDGSGDLTAVSRLTTQGATPATDVWATTTCTYLTGKNAHIIDRITSPTGKTPIVNHYDPDTGRLLYTIDAFGKQIDYTHNVGARQEIIEDRRGNQTVYIYDNRGNVLTETDPTGLTTAYEYGNSNNAALPTKITTAVGTPLAFSTEYTYDGSGYKTSESYTVDGHLMKSDWRYAATSFGHLLKTAITPDGIATHNIYDSSTGVLLETDVYDSGNADTETFGNLLQKTTYGDYINGQPTKITQWLKNESTGVWSAYSVSRTILDSAGRPTEMRQEAADGTLLTRSTFVYDSNGNQTHAIAWNTTPPVHPTGSVPPLRPDSTPAAEIIGGITWYACTVSQSVFDAQNRVIKTIDPQGNVSQTFYTADGQVDYTIDPRGHKTKNEYNDLGQIETTYQNYSTSNQTGTSMTYDDDGHAKTSTDALGNVATMYYDGAGRNVQTLYSDGTGSETVYDVAGRTSYTTDRHVVGVAANSTHYLYDAAGRSIGSERFAGTVITVTTAGQTSSSTLTNEGSKQSFTTIHYNALGQVDYSIDAAGKRTDLHYDAMGRQFETLQPETDQIDPNDGSVDRVRPTTTTTFDSLGRQRTVTAPEVWIQDSLGHWVTHRAVTTFTYNELGQQTKVTLDDGSFVSAQYDALARKIAEDAQRKTADTARTTTYVYDAAGNLTDVLQPAVVDGDPDSPTFGESVHPHYHYSYNQFGEQLTQVDAKGRVTTFHYDAWGRQDQRTLPEVTGEPTATEYTTYDKFGRATTHTDFNAQVTEYIYSDDSRVTGSEHNSLGRLVFKRYFASASDKTAYYAGDASKLGDSTHCTYDSLGRQASYTDSTGTTSFTYDSITQQVASVSNPQGVINYAYNATTSQLIRTFGSTLGGTNVTTDTRYTYDELGRLKTVTAYKLGGQDFTSSPKVTTYSYTAAGALDTVALPNDVITDYDFDSLNRLVHEVIKTATRTIQTYDYELRNDGNRASALEVDYDNSGTVDSTVKFIWTYDALSRLTSETYDLDNDGPSSGDYIDTYDMDLVGNRMNKQHDTDADTTIDEEIEYLYNDRDQLDSETSSVGGVTSYTYDANGSTLTKINISASVHVIYDYDLRNRMVTVDTNGDSTTDVTYLYDDAGNRVAQITSSSSTYFLIDANNQTGYSQTFEESATQGGSPARAYEIGRDIIAQVSAAAVQYLLKDGHGSTAILINTLTQIIERYHYDAYGNPLGFSPVTALTAHLYNSEAFASSTGFYFQRARWYVPSDGRFSSFDNFSGVNSNPSTLGKYLYTHSNPINLTDPSGNNAIFEWLVATALKVSLFAWRVYKVVQQYRIAEQMLYWGAVASTVMFALAMPQTITGTWVLKLPFSRHPLLKSTLPDIEFGMYKAADSGWKTQLRLTPGPGSGTWATYTRFRFTIDPNNPSNNSASFGVNTPAVKLNDNIKFEGITRLTSKSDRTLSIKFGLQFTFSLFGALSFKPSINIYTGSYDFVTDKWSNAWLGQSDQPD